MKHPTILQEQDGAFSMRRTLALLYALSSNGCLWLPAPPGSQARGGQLGLQSADQPCARQT